MAASALTPTVIALPNDIIYSILDKLPFQTIEKIRQEGNDNYDNYDNYILKRGKKIIIFLEEFMHPDSGYKPIEADFDFTNLDIIKKHIWNMIICLKGVSEPNLPPNLLHDACSFITMECDYPESYDTMCDNIWEYIILRYLDSEYDETTNYLLGGYKKWKYIYSAIEEYPHIHALDTPAKQKHALAILIMTYIEHKDEIMHMYEEEYEQIDTDEKYYNVLKSMICVVSGNGHLGAEMIPQQFVENTFYFMTQ